MPLSSFRAAIRMCCPSCGEESLFDGLLAVRSHCPHCTLDLRNEDSGDGPAAFVIFIVASIMIPLALALEFELDPPIWLHVIIWPPAILGLSILLIRIGKAFFIAQQFRHKSGES